ncbi:hypothetical protein M3Y97_00988200 [Aphelenchoides bicaudatus]|nr:hypothetical protein M3Y97_00988200 [Aphelenchoides bicaudatus]
MVGHDRQHVTAILPAAGLNLATTRWFIDGEDDFDLTLEKLQTCWHQTYETAWRLAELHIHRLILFFIVLMSTYHFCAINFVSILIVIVTLYFPSQKRLASFAISAYMTTLFFVQFFAIIFKSRLDGWEPGTCNFTKPDKKKSKETLMDWIGLD